jgi:hypothetical protein
MVKAVFASPGFAGFLDGKPMIASEVTASTHHASSKKFAT